MTDGFVGVVLAAGQGTRMKSATPKVLHRIMGRPMVAWVVQAALDAGAAECVVVVGHGRDEVRAALTERFGDRVRFAVQEEQNGTGHAVQIAMQQCLPDYDGGVLILYGDCPCLRATRLRELAGRLADVPFALVTSTLQDPTGYGRILRDGGRVVGIREHRDCSDEERAITEVNPGLYATGAAFLRESLGKLTSDNAQGELYLTDVVAMAADVADLHAPMDELRGVNDRWELSLCAATLLGRRREALARSGVGMADPSSVFVDADCEVEADAILAPGVHLRGKTVVRAGATVDVGCVLTDVTVEAGATLLPYTVAADSTIGPAANVGPFTHLRPATVLGEGSKVGNFCETKKTTLGKGSKVNHLAYVGDGQIGEGVNIGAGVIFCNYDGVQKHTTTLEDGVFIGSDSQLVAPLTVGKGAYVASGSTVTKDVPADALALSRTKQVNKEGYASRLRARFAALKKKLAE